MKIDEQNSLRVLILAIALTLVGGATAIMFYASQQNESVLASETELLALRAEAGNCASGYVDVNGKCEEIKSCPSGQKFNEDGTQCVEITDPDEYCEYKYGEGYFHNGKTCVKKGEDCAEGFEKNSAGKCEEKKSCPDGQKFNEDGTQCVEITDPDEYCEYKYGEGYFHNGKTCV